MLGIWFEKTTFITKVGGSKTNLSLEEKLLESKTLNVILVYSFHKNLTIYAEDISIFNFTHIFCRFSHILIYNIP